MAPAKDITPMNGLAVSEQRGSRTACGRIARNMPNSAPGKRDWNYVRKISATAGLVISGQSDKESVPWTLQRLLWERIPL
jgi:hypothetical protein